MVHVVDRDCDETEYAREDEVHQVDVKVIWISHHRMGPII